MKKNPNLWTSSFGDIAETLKSLDANGVTLDHLIRLRFDKDFAMSVGRFIANGGKEPVSKPLNPVVTEYNLQVNYDLTIEEALNTGKYDFSRYNIMSKDFSTTRRGTADVGFQLVHFKRDISSEAVIDELDWRRCRPANIYELLALGNAHPELQLQHMIIGLGSIKCNYEGKPEVPCLHSNGSHRIISLVWLRTWHRNSRFAVVPK